jgi:leucyl-tRNA synthetase
LSSDDAIEKMQAWLTTQGIGGKKINYRMQDRVFSRQRYRGEPFPILRTETQPKLRINFYEQATRQAILE